MSQKQDLLKRIEALEISKKLIDDEIAQAKNSLEEIEAKQQAAWEENPYAKDRTTRRLADYCRSLGYFIVGCQTKEPDSRFYAIAKTILKRREDAVPFLKELYRHGDKKFSYSIAELPADRKTDLLNICTKMKANGWISFTNSKSELLVTSSFPKTDRNFLNGGWAEDANRYLVNKVLTDYSRSHKLKFKVFWDVRLKQIDSDRSNSHDMQLDLAVQINDIFYIFETKSSVLGIQKWVERAAIFSQNGNRFMTCCVNYSSVNPKLFQPYRLLALEHLEEQLIELLDYDFPPPKPDCGQMQVSPTVQQH